MTTTTETATMKPICSVCLGRHDQGEPTDSVTIERYTLNKVPGRYARTAFRSQYIIRWDGHFADQGSIPLADVRSKARRLAHGRPVVEAWK